MARTNPQKRPRKYAKKTIIFYGEGSAEEVFLKHLKKTYARDSGVAVTVKSGQGGAADEIIRKAFRYTLGGFDKRVVWLDNDKPKAEMEKARTMAKSSGIILIENRPCLEAFLLGILNGGKVSKNKSSGYYKKEFESKHICKKKRCDIFEYEKIFPKKKLDSARKKVMELDEIVGFMEGKRKNKL